MIRRWLLYWFCEFLYLLGWKRPAIALAERPRPQVKGWNPLAATPQPWPCWNKGRGHNRFGIVWFDHLPSGHAHCQECGGRLSHKDKRKASGVPWSRKLVVYAPERP